MKGNPVLIQSRVIKQVIKVKHKHNLLLDIITLICYVLMITKKWLLISENRGDLNRCTPCRENQIRMTRTLLALVHVCHTYAFSRQSPHVATFHADPTELDRFTTPERKCSRLHLSARLSGLRDLPQFLSQHCHWSSALKSNICWWTCYVGLLGPYLQHVISIFNTCSRGQTIGT
jgi:hypothetical protein